MIPTHQLLGLLLCAATAMAFSCKDQNGRDVDWFMAYKMPELKDNSIPGAKDGLGFYYLDSNNRNGLVVSPETLNSSNQAVAYTLQQFYNKNGDTNILHVMYNDEPYVPYKLRNRVQPLRAYADEYGHTKGVTFFDSTSGLWLIHSVPKFPPPTEYAYPPSGTEYGQTFFCISLTSDSIDIVGQQLFYNRPQIYSSNMPTAAADKYPYMAQVIKKKYQKAQPANSKQLLITKQGTFLTSFAKSGMFNQDLYQAFVAPELKANLEVESWRRGELIPQDCSLQYTVADAQTLQVGQSTLFKYTKDHSKFARSLARGNPWVCIGDINRMTSQYERGGGTTCIRDVNVWSAFDVFKTIQSCN